MFNGAVICKNKECGYNNGDECTAHGIIIDESGHCYSGNRKRCSI